MPCVESVFERGPLWLVLLRDGDRPGRSAVPPCPELAHRYLPTMRKLSCARHSGQPWLLRTMRDTWAARPS